MEKGAVLSILFFFYNGSKKTGKRIKFKVYTCTIYATDKSLAACVVFVAMIYQHERAGCRLEM